MNVSLPSIQSAYQTLEALREMLRGFLKLGLLITLAVSLTGVCTSCQKAPATLTTHAVTETMQAAATLIAVGERTPSTLISAPIEIITPAATLTPTSTPTIDIVHIDFPGQPEAQTSSLTDRSTAPLAEEQRAIGDSFERNIFERPFDAENMEYLAYIDITPGAELLLDPPWVYISIFLEGAPPEDSQAIYAVELDLNIDGRGDWLLITRTPQSDTWSTQGVQAYLDADGDVGGEMPSHAETPPYEGNGYESLLFNEGSGIDPDAVFSRILLEPQTTIQIALNHSIIANDRTFMWGVWAFDGNIHPELFEYNDTMTFKEAGSPIPANSNYPLKELASVDSTCRWVQGIVPRKDIPSTCGYHP
jgi:hypothetical protein